MGRVQTISSYFTLEAVTPYRENCASVCTNQIQGLADQNSGNRCSGFRSLFDRARLNLIRTLCFLYICTRICMFMLWHLVGRCWYGGWLPCRCLLVDVGRLPFWFVLSSYAFLNSIGHSICASPIHFHSIYRVIPCFISTEISTEKFQKLKQ